MFEFLLTTLGHCSSFSDHKGLIMCMCMLFVLKVSSPSTTLFASLGGFCVALYCTHSVFLVCIAIMIEDNIL